MTRARLVLMLLAALALLGAATPGTAGAARGGALKVALPSAGDITVAHVVFERSAARGRRLPRFRLAGRSRRVLRAYRVGAAGATFRVRRGRVVGSVVLLRRWEAGQRATPRRAAVRIATDGPVAFALAERNALADLRRRNATAADDAAEGFEPIDGFGDFDESGLGACRVGSKFRLIGDPNPPPLTLSLFMDLPVGDEDVPSDGTGFGGLGIRQRNWVFEVGYAAACDDIERFEDKPGEEVVDDFYYGLGAALPVTCQIVSTYVSPVTDSNGNRLTPGSFSSQFGCDIVVNGMTLRLPGHTITDCQASAGLDCRFVGDMAGTRIPIRSGETGSFSLRADPELQRGDRYEIEIDTPEGNLRVEDVM